MTKTKREIELESNLKIVASCFFVILVIWIMTFTILGVSKNKFKQQLQSCQEDVEKEESFWEIEYYCDWNNIGIYFLAYYNFTNYEDYLSQLENIKIMSCEVIE